MKKSIAFLLSFLLWTVIANAQKTPYAMVRISDDMYFDQTEVDVGSWLSFYTWVLVHEGYEVAQQVLPDSSALEQELWEYIKEKSTNYITIEASYSQQPIGYFAKECKRSTKFNKRLYPDTRYCNMLSFPITGITFRQAMKFCEWRSVVQGNGEFTFRLPSTEEWIAFAQKGLTTEELKKQMSDSLIDGRCPSFNYHTNGCDDNYLLGKLLGIGIFKGNKIRAYDVFGNVSEMTSIEGIAKGGNYSLYASQSHLDSVQHYIKPSLWLGFRCVAERKNKRVKTSFTFTDSLDLSKPNSRYGKMVDPRDGKTYPTVVIGNQVWMAANLAYKPIGEKFWAYQNEDKYVSRYGYLYNWETAKNVCPEGWSLPSLEDFEILLYTIGGNGSDLYYKMMINGESGFSIIDGGIRLGVNFTVEGTGTAFWSKSQNKNKFASLMSGRLEQTIFISKNSFRSSGFYVRCIKHN